MQKRLVKNHDSNSNDLSHHILPNSATMVGVCIMVISIVKSYGSRTGELPDR